VSTVSTNDTLVISDIVVEVTRKEIKNLHLAVYPPNGRVTVSAPRTYVAGCDSDSCNYPPGLGEKGAETDRTCPRQSPREMVDGESHYFLGQRYRMQVVEKVAGLR